MAIAEMKCQRLTKDVGPVRTLALESPADTLMKVFTLSLQKAFISHFLYQRVFEYIDGFTWIVAVKNQPQ